MAMTESQKIINRLLPPEVRRMRSNARKRRQRQESTDAESRQAKATGQDKRQRPRVTIHDINKQGVKALQNAGVTPQKVQQPDDRSGFATALDWLDVSRNTVAQSIASLAGMDVDKIKDRGTFGMKQIFMSDVLGHLGMEPGVLRAVLGFIGDVAIDPLTYLSAGASTGLKIGKHAPRLRRPLVKALKTLSKGNASRMTPAMIKALGGAKKVKAYQKFARMGGKQASKKMMSRRGGMLTQKLAKNLLPEASKAANQATRALLKKPGMAMKSRKLLRIPFTQLSAINIPGRQAKAFKALNLGKGGDEFFARYRQLGSFKKEVADLHKGRTEIMKLRALSKTDPAQAKIADDMRKKWVAARDALMKKGTTEGVFKEGMKPTMKNIMGHSASELNKLRGHGGAPTVVKMARAAEQGVSHEKNSIRGALQRMFGGTMNPQKMQELGIEAKRTYGAGAREHRAFQYLQPDVDRIAQMFVDSKRVATMDEGRALLMNSLDLRNYADDMGRLNPKDAGRVLWEKGGVREVADMPEVQKFSEKFKKLMDDSYAEGVKRKLKLRDKMSADFYAPRVADKGVQPYLAQQSSMMGGKGSLPAEAAKGVDQPFTMARSRTSEFIDPVTGETRQIMSRSHKVDEVMKAGGRRQMEWIGPDGKIVQQAGQDYAPHTQEMIDAFGKDPMRKGWKIQPKEWDTSMEHINQMVANDTEGGLRSILGHDDAFRGKPVTKFFNMDPASAGAARIKAQATASAAADLRDLVQKNAIIVDPAQFGSQMYQGFSIPDALAPNNPMREWIGSTVFGNSKQQIAYPKPVTDMINRTAKIFEGGAELNQLLKASDTTLAWFKKWALFHPAYVIRNMWQNLLGTMMAGGNPITATKYAIANKSVKRMAKAIEAGNLADLDGIFIRLGGKKVPLRALADDAITYNFAGANAAAANTAPGWSRELGRAKGVWRKIQKPLVQGGDSIRTWNTVVENRQRIGAWFAFMEQGLTPRQAAMQTLLAMPDLSNVTKMEKALMVRVFPWYRWMKNNGALQLMHYLPQKPAYMAGVGKLQNFAEAFGETVPDELRPEWMRDAMATQLTGDKEEGSALLIRNLFPFEEVQSMASGLSHPGDMGRYLYSGARPGLKFGAEMATGSDMYRQRPIQPFTMGEAMGHALPAIAGASGTPLDNLLAIRPIKEYGRRVWEQPSTMGKIGRATIGGAVQPLSAARGRQEINFKTAKKIALLRQKYIRSLENQDVVEQQNLLRQFMKAQMRRQRFGLQVPRDTTRVLKETGYARQPR